jgi:hypothetical protein
MALLRSRMLAFVCLAVSFIFLGAFASPETASQAGDDAVLKDILENTRVYCQKLQDWAYYFICREAVKETLRGKTAMRWSAPAMSTQEDIGAAQSTTPVAADSTVVNKYIYDYQLIRQKGNDQETRILIEKNGLKTEVRDARLEAMRFNFKNMAFGPIDLFGMVGRLRHEYRIVGRGAIAGDKVVIVEASATKETSEYNPGGKVWIRESDNAILRIDWDQETLPGFDNILAAAKDAGAAPSFTLTTEFGVEKNGVRFPSRAVFQEAYTRAKSKRRQIVSQVDIDYRDYKFFQVSVAIETK